jgi:hypothetical protein
MVNTLYIRCPPSSKFVQIGIDYDIKPSLPVVVR